MLEKLPKEILLNEILSDFNLEDVFKLVTINKKLNKVLQDEAFCQRLLKLHFPHLKANTKAYEALINAYKEEYSHGKTLLPIRIRRLFSLVKAGDLYEIKNAIAAPTSLLTLSDLYQKDAKQRSILRWASKNNHQHILNYFYDLAVKVYSSTGSLNVVQSDSHKRTILHWAVSCGQSAETINQLLSLGAKINETDLDGLTPLRIAAREGYLEIVKLLLEKNADIHVASISGMTPLYAAAENGHFEIVQLLLEKGADIHAVSSKEKVSPLYIAASNGHLEIVKFLLEKGADVNTQVNYFNTTPLHVAVEKGYLDIVKVLLAHNADTQIKGIYVGTPLMLAKEKNQREIEALLIAVDLKTYKKEIEQLPDNHRRKFGFFTYGPSAKEEKEAITALDNVINNKGDKKTLTPYLKILNSSQLKPFYTTLITSATAISRSP